MSKKGEHEEVWGFRPRRALVRRVVGEPTEPPLTHFSKL